MPQLDDDDDIRARRRALAERELALREAEIDSRLKELWWTPPRMIAFALAAGIIIVLLGMSVGAFFSKCCTDSLHS
jgi:hypothetical protein